MKKQVSIWTDGSASPNPGVGGYGVIIKYGDVVQEYWGGEPDTTNNRMELTAAIVGLGMLTSPCKVTLYSDSQYVTNPYNKHWIKKWRQKNLSTRKNGDLWELLDYEANRHSVEFVHVPAHCGIELNERADRLAARGSQKFKK